MKNKVFKDSLFFKLLHDHFIDGAFVGWLYIEKDKVAQLRQRIDNYPWHMNSTDRYNLLNRT
ncbi:hypothetical protein ABFO59_13335 [Acinetobacter radioresistens]|uniref:hypothetical protein n=1 Tax=Acinetobacter radioresistens TaxID=40216 RepID=UPI003212B886